MKSIKFLILAILMANVTVIMSQSIDIERVITDDYPTLRAEFRVMDANGDEVRNLNENDFELKDNGIVTDITSPICPPDQSRFSLILIFDGSTSMDWNLEDDGTGGTKRIEVVKNVARNFIDRLPEGQFEAAMGFFATWFKPEGYLDFTTDKDELKNNLNRYIADGNTNYNKAFLGNDANQNGGAFEFVSRAQYKPIIVFLSDGAHNIIFGDIESSIINRKARETNTTVYSILIGPSGGIDANASESFLNNLSRNTGGEFSNGVVSERDIQRIYSDILEAAEGFGTPAPCYVEFESGCDDGEIELTYSGFDPSVSDTESYTIDEDVKPNLDIDERTFLEVNLPLNQTTQFDVEIKAENNFLEITGFNSTPANIFTVSDWGGSAPPFTLNEDESRTIKVEITPDNREFFGGNITFEGTGCSGLTMTPRAGFIFAEDIIFGSVNQGEDKTETFTQRFCNLTDEPLDIERILISGGTHQSDFAVTTQNGNLAPGECIDIEAYFSPSEQGDREAEYTVKTDKGDFSALLKGGGAGNPEIAGVAPEFADVNCTSPNSEITIELKNDGPVDLLITAVQLADDTHFNYIGSQNIIVPANGTNNTDAVVQFDPQSVGNHTTDVEFINNSEISPYRVTVSGEMIGINYNTSVENVDFGTICANTGNPSTQKITLTNLNSFGYSVTANSDSPEFNTDAVDYDISSGSEEVTISFESGTNGIINGMITFVSECGNVEKIVNVTGEINTPEVTDMNELIASVVGSSGVKTVSVLNPNSEDFDVVNAFVGDATQTPLTEFAVSNTSFTVPGNGSFDVDISYTPDPNNANEIDGFLYLVVEQPCDVTLDNILIKGVPDLAVANLNANSSSDYIGATTQISFDVIGSTEFNNSGTSKIEFTLQYDETMLNPLTGTKTVANQVSYIVDLPNPFPGTMAFVTEFEVLNSLPVQQSDLLIVDSRALNDQGDFTATIVNTDGVFDLILADANVSTNNLSATPGQEFELPIFIDDEDNDMDNDLHNEVKVKVKYNFTVMQPLNIPFTIVSQDMAEFELTSEIDFTNQPKQASVLAQLPVANVKMLAKLGNKIETPIEIITAEVTSGGVADFTLDSKMFTLEGVCEDGGNLRLFTLSEIEPSITINENPVSEKIDLTLSTIETGEHSIVLFDMIGNAVELDKRIVNSNGQVYSIDYDVSNLQSGMYVIIYDTPTQSFNQRVMIVK